jgi:hypothetical protein
MLTLPLTLKAKRSLNSNQCAHTTATTAIHTTAAAASLQLIRQYHALYSAHSELLE